MTERVFLHVGPHKTGTTFLQAVLRSNREALVEDGVLFPPARYKAQRQAVLEKLGQLPPHLEPTGRWDRLAGKVAAWQGRTALVSHERLAAASPEQVESVLESLAPAAVHVVYGARDLSRVIPGLWQTRLRNGATETWREFLAAVRDGDDWPGLWAEHDPRRALASWERFVPRERFHVLTVPPSAAPEELWRRFSTVVGLRPERYHVSMPVTSDSLGVAETELLRQLNVRLARTRGGDYGREVRRKVVRPVLVRRAGRRYALPESEHGWLRARVQEHIDFLRGYDVTGDLADLQLARPSGVAPDDVEPQEVTDAAVDVVAFLQSAETGD